MLRQALAHLSGLPHPALISYCVARQRVFTASSSYRVLIRVSWGARGAVATLGNKRRDCATWHAVRTLSGALNLSYLMRGAGRLTRRVGVLMRGRRGHRQRRAASAPLSRPSAVPAAASRSARAGCCAADLSFVARSPSARLVHVKLSDQAAITVASLRWAVNQLL